MHAMQLIRTTAAQWGLQRELPPMLREACAVCTSEQNAGCKAAGRHCPSQRQTHAGANLGVREPDFGETPLSDAEVLVGMREGVFK